MQGNPIFMRQAIQLATENVVSGRGGPFGALVIKEGKVIATGYNLTTTTNDPTAHAEIVAIRNACKALNTFVLSGCEIYTNCEPCPMCLSAIYWARCGAIYYASTPEEAADAGFDDAFHYAELKLPHNQRTIPITPMLREEAASSFIEWRQYADRIEY